VSNETEVRPFRVGFPEEELAELRRRIAATRWPERETVTGDSQGVPLAMMQNLTAYWGNGYDWRKCEENLNALPNFITEIDGLDIHFIHVRSQHQDALPLIVTHGWPGSVIEQLKIIEPLTNPAAHGASAADAFHLVSTTTASSSTAWAWTTSRAARSPAGTATSPSPCSPRPSAPNSGQTQKILMGPSGRFRADENGGAHGARRRRLGLALRDRPKD
jgi:hypothetical protein